ncbi:ABC transporter ATP-binding protein [Marivivens marinus]|uniref:ABC transporter ATP-binding protein n=1 Tax=Marivivens marinus TaxID=3110173 RepID=UPI003B8465F2
MINIEGLWKSYKVGNTRKYVARGIDLTLPTGSSVALLGRNGAGKSTLLRMIAGIEDPDEGQITSTGSISWPVGFAGSFHPDLSGAQNVRFVGRVYGVDTDDLVSYVREFSDIGPHFNAPFRTYSAGMRSRLAFGLSMGIDFDTYLIDEVTSVGDAAFRETSAKVLQERTKDRSAIIVTHSMPLLKQLCSTAVLLTEGRATFFDDIEDAIKAHEDAMSANRSEGRQK